jgi:ribosome-binding protein aMBF1 (putative translation factor)
MSAGGDYDDDHDDDDDRVREDGEWQHITIPISEEEDYEVVFSPSDFCQMQQGEHQQLQQEETIVDTSNISNNIMDRVQEWNRQRNLQRNQLGASISKTFTELSREEPDQMEEDAIKRAMELSMLDVALVYHRHDHSQQRQQHQQILLHKILDVSENAHPTEIKTAYRKLARLHVSITMCYIGT